MGKLKIHNEWFMPLAKKTCFCGTKKTSVFAWGEYHNGKWSKITDFCQDCYQDRILTRLISHAGPCGCTFSFNSRSGHSIPTWILEMGKNALESNGCEVAN